MKKPMSIAISRSGVSVLYKCYKMGHGKRCPDKNTDKCLTCKYAKAEMSAFDATRLMNSFGRKHDSGTETKM